MRAALAVDVDSAVPVADVRDRGAYRMGYLLSRQLVAPAEHVVDVPAALAARIRILGTGRSSKTDPQ